MTTHTPTDGGPAFPQPLTFSPSGTAEVARSYFDNVEGMSLRDWFAGMILQGLLANSGGPIQANGMNGWNFVNCEASDVVDMSIGLADTMIAARERKEPS